MKKGKLKRSKKRIKKISTQNDKLWELCKTIVRKRDGNTCFICGMENLEKSNWHTGHFIPSKDCGFFLRYDLRNIHSSCYRCNINLGGNGSMYYRRMRAVYGDAFVDALFRAKLGVFTPAGEFYHKAYEFYGEIANWDQDRLRAYTRQYTGWSEAFGVLDIPQISPQDLVPSSYFTRASE